MMWSPSAVSVTGSYEASLRINRYGSPQGRWCVCFMKLPLYQAVCEMKASLTRSCHTYRYLLASWQIVVVELAL